ncbi:hypothetical protein [Streptomyces griseus]|uniref:hypothetical protein n=1 Tax=Streptomyces griseus TaxID=1911 RepID=UPI0008408219|nr:hypothetical protein [Streptomyces griseus]
MDDAKDRTPVPHEGGEGCLTTLVRIPVRLVVLVLVLPVRMVWDLAVGGARALDRVLLRPLGRGLERLYATVVAPTGRALAWLAVAVLVRPWTALWRHLVVPGVRYGIVVPLMWLHATVVTPAGRGLRWVYRTLLVPAGRVAAATVVALVTVVLVWPVAAVWRHVLEPLGRAGAWLARQGLVRPVLWVHRHLLTPLGHALVHTFLVLGRGLAATVRGLGTAAVRMVVTLLVVPVSWVYRRILVPVGRETAAAVGVAWRIAGFVSRAVGRGLVWLARHLVGAPAGWVYRAVCTPVGHVLRDAVLAPARRAVREAGRAARGVLGAARETLRAARRDAWRALVGKPQVTAARELEGSAARTLGRTTTVPSAATAPEISLPVGSAGERG